MPPGRLGIQHVLNIGLKKENQKLIKIILFMPNKAMNERQEKLSTMI